MVYAANIVYPEIIYWENGLIKNISVSVFDSSGTSTGFTNIWGVIAGYSPSSLGDHFYFHSHLPVTYTGSGTSRKLLLSVDIHDREGDVNNSPHWLSKHYKYNIGFGEEEVNSSGRPYRLWPLVQWSFIVNKDGSEE